MNFIVILLIIFVLAVFGLFYLYILYKNLKSHMEQSRVVNQRLNNKKYKYTPKNENFLSILYKQMYMG